MMLEKLKEELEYLLPVDKIEEWESMTTREQDYCYALMNGFESIKNSILETIKAIEDTSSFKGTWLYKRDKDKKEIKAVRDGYISKCKEAIDIMEKMMNEE